MSEFRRRMMQTTGEVAPYPDPWEDDGKIWAYVNVTTTESATTIGYGNITRYRGMEIDGVSVTPTASYQFSTTGEHLVKLDISGGLYTYTFFNTASLRRCYLPDGLTWIPNDFFQLDSNLTFVRLPSSMASVGQRSFSGCSSLVIKDLSLPSLTTLNTNSFNNTRIKKITDLGSITAIPGNYVFASNPNLTSVVLPSSITDIGTGAFDACTGLKTLTCQATNPPTIGYYAFRSVSFDVIYVPSASVADYQAASGWSSYASIITAI